MRTKEEIIESRKNLPILDNDIITKHVSEITDALYELSRNALTVNKEVAIHIIEYPYLYLTQMYTDEVIKRLETMGFYIRSCNYNYGDSDYGSGAIMHARIEVMVDEPVVPDTLWQRLLNTIKESITQ